MRFIVAVIVPIIPIVAGCELIGMGGMADRWITVDVAADDDGCRLNARSGHLETEKMVNAVLEREDRQASP